MSLTLTHLLVMAGAFIAPYILQAVSAALSKKSGVPVGPTPVVPPAPSPLADSHPLLDQLEPILMSMVQQMLADMIKNASQAKTQDAAK